jgi:hypothetical protein
MSGKKDVQCEYLAADRRSCTAVAQVEGQAARSQQCSGKPKDLCCYLCDNRGSCEIGCTFLDQTSEEKEEEKNSQTSPSVYTSKVEEAFICPFCGAPYRALLPAGVIQVKCGYCGATVLVPPHLGGGVQQCPNHPGVLATGICNGCEKSYCDRCLYIFDGRDGRFYLCSECYKSRNSTRYLTAATFAFFAIVFLVIVVAATISRPELGGGALAIVVLVVAVWLLVSFVIFSNAKKRPLSIHDSRESRSVLLYSAFYEGKCQKCDL